MAFWRIWMRGPRRARRRWCGFTAAIVTGLRCYCRRRSRRSWTGALSSIRRPVVGNLRDRMLFSVLAESGIRLGEALGLRISDFVLGRGGTAYIEIVPRAGNANGARVKMIARAAFMSALAWSSCSPIT